MTHGIAITGSGIVCAIGADKTMVADALKSQRSGIGTMQHLKSTHKELPVGEVKMTNDQLKESLGVATTLEISRTSLLGAYALRQAIDDAGFTVEQLNKSRVALISGTTVGGMDITEQHYKAMTAGDVKSLQYIEQHDCGSNTNDIAKILGLRCQVTTISTACSSAINAIILGARMLLAGEVDYVLAGGSESLSLFHLNGFNSLMILDHEQCRPFDSTRQGLNLGEGAAFVVLQRTDSLGQDAIVQAYVAGFGNRCDAFHQTATSPEGIGAYLAMKDALTMANIAPETIDYINAHGTGTPDNDRSESVAIAKLFGSQLPYVSSTKSYTGHTTSASGSIETVISLIAMHEHFVPVNIPWASQDADCLTPYIESGVSRDLHTVLCNSFGFGGNDSSLLLTDYKVQLEATKADETRILAESEVCTVEELAGLKEFISPIETRRMSKMMKASLLTSIRCLKEAGIQQPDAIIIATRFGMLENGEKILDNIVTNGEDGISPTQFMQSTHNTIAGALAIRFNCHGYNITYSQGSESLDWALRDARKLLAEGKVKTVLVGLHDECPPKFQSFYKACGIEVSSELVSKSILMSL